MNRKQLVWTLVFLPLTAAAIALECWAGLDDSDNTVPWTDYISTYVPWPIALVVFLALAFWLPPHFIDHYRLKRAERERKANRPTPEPPP